MRIPPRITAGDQVSWTDYAQNDSKGNPVSSTDYAMTYSFRGPISGAGIDVSGTANGTGWDVTLSPTQTAAFNVGGTNAMWYWQAYATKTGVRHTLGSGQLVVLPNFALISGTFDGRSQAEQDLTAIEATIRARSTGSAVQEYTIGNRSTKYMTLGDLLEWRTRLQMQVARERRAQAIKNGLGAPDRVGVRFK